ncbi:hypothetical protein FACS189449_09080 [Alphaproteobacteria bacterium]|nr:hypothetical protein FACS189449_09080 [Alphaproteobacteria bacterium]
MKNMLTALRPFYQDKNEQTKFFDALGETAKQLKEATEKKKEAYNLLKQKAVFHEACKVSREPDVSEKTVVDNLKKLLGFEDTDEVRYMDPAFLIEGMELPKDEKDKLLGFLSAAKGNKEVIEYIEKYLDECDYIVSCIDDPNKECSLTREGLKEEVMRNILEGCRKSTIYQNAFITLIARTKMPQTFLSTRINTMNTMLPKWGRLSFRTSDSPKSALDKIEYNNKGLYFQSLHDGLSKIKNLSNGLFSYPSDMSEVLSHECGHSISADIAEFASEEATMAIVAKLVTRRYNYDESSDYFKKLWPENQDGLKRNPKGAKELELKTTEPLTADLAKELFQNTMEVFQIMGLGVFENDGKKVLCINPLSDFAISMELGEPIRWGHAGIDDSTDFKYSKTKVYDALFSILHSSAWKYETKLTIKKCWSAIKSGWNWLFPSKKVKNA